ncbi:MAG TPA: hypothetical protein VHC63_18525 [Acidimicrobiales bacterium]|nr:hypothetical protein [Acidimicrobiales bacterium]
MAQAQEELAIAYGEERARLRAIAGRAQATSVLASQRARPVRGPLASLFPHGLRPGASVAVRAGRPSLDGAAMRNAITLAAGVVPPEGWVAAVGVPGLGVLAAAEAGLALERLVFFDAPVTLWGTVAIAAVDAFDVVVLSVPARPRPAEVRRLSGRARERGTTIVAVGPGVAAWPSDARLVTAAVAWDGLGDGHGTLRSCRVTVDLDGRGAVRPRQVDLVL